MYNINIIKVKETTLKIPNKLNFWRLINMERKFEFLMNSWKKESLGGKIAIAFVIISAIVAPFMIIPDIISFFDSFEQFMDVVIGLFVLIVIAILGIILSSPSVTYTKPHRYVVRGELDKDYKKEEGFRTTVYTKKRR